MVLLLLLPFSILMASADQGDCEMLEGEGIRWVVPTRPGGGYDAYSRLIQPFLEERLDVQIHIDNRPEAGGLVGAMAIRDASPDGKTLGIINASGLLAARLIEDSMAPNPATDFTVLGQVVSNRVVLFSGSGSGFSDISELIDGEQQLPVIVGVRDVGSASFFSIPITMELLGIEYALVSGYVGSAARVMALMRGEVDIIAGSFDSLGSHVRNEELVPLLQLSPTTDSGLDIPRLGGPDGLAIQRAEKTGRTPEQAVQQANDLADIVGAGRLVVAPPDLPGNLLACLENTLGEVLQSTGFLQAADRARLSIQYKNGVTARQGLVAGERGVTQFRDQILAAIEQVRE